MKTKKIIFAISLLILLFSAVDNAFSQTTAFNFQGRLNDGGNAANSNYDFQFKLFDSLAGGNQVGSTNHKPNLQVINGVFSAVLDFGAIFDAGNRFLEISVRPAGSPNAPVILGARQQILAVPFAANSANSTNSVNSLSLGGVSASGYARLNFNNQGNLNTNGNLQIVGNATQPADSNGFVKAMLAVDGNSLNTPIARCFNGVTNSTSGNCGFTVTEPIGKAIGVYRINFSFPITNRFVAVTCEYDSPGGVFGENNCGANYRRFDNTTMEVFTFFTNDVEDTAAANFTIVLF